VFDGYQNETFKLSAMVFCTINDFPAYGNLSGYNVKGHRACPICEEVTSYIQLKHGRKLLLEVKRMKLRRYASMVSSFLSGLKTSILYLE